MKNVSSYKIIIATLILLVLGSMFMGLSLAYFSNHESLKKANTPIEIVATDLGATAYSVELTENSNKLNLKIKTPENLKSNLMRVKFNLNNGQNANTELDERWQQGVDNYYYYTGQVKDNQTIDFNPTINVDDKNEKLNIIVETNIDENLIMQQNFHETNLMKKTDDEVRF